MRILTVNSGSSSIRLDLMEEGEPPLRAASWHRSGSGARRADLDELLARDPGNPPSVVAHRVVHGGSFWTAPTLLDGEVERRLETLVPLAPLHLPGALAWIREARRALPSTPQLAVFDTGFYARLPAVAATYALPRALAERRYVRRYGFHGLAHAAMWRSWQELGPPGRRVVTLQLGSGCSATAILDGKPLDTSMGFSPTEGLVMATRSGDVDPGAVLYLQRAEGLAPDAMERLLTESSGLLGLSGSTGDMAKLSTLDDPAARLAIELFAYRVRKYVGAYAAVLGGLDGIVFGGGIGEHSPMVRAACLQGLEHLGVRLDPAANERAVRGESRLDHPASTVAIFSVSVDEAGELARNASGWYGASAGTPAELH